MYLGSGTTNLTEKLGDIVQKIQRLKIKTEILALSYYVK